ncbi:MAG TPA: HAMP domain-containing sensor histidine kinase, partial [Anaerolineae bacterium]|nr:HAMP domain-containing sensor histidine kinase [Anaerolineae bacterium]
ALLAWVLPLVLFLVVVGYETQEHLIRSREPISVDLSAEILFFGVVGPTVVGLTLSWIARSLAAREQVEAEVRQLNADLEQRVESRTRSLQRANEELSQINAELQTLDRLKSEFVSLVSHELRAPLTNINGGIELLLSDEDLSASQRQTLTVTLNQSQRLGRLVDTILDVSTLESGRWPLNPGPVALPLLVEQVIREMRPRAGRHRIERLMGTDLPFAWADEDSVAVILHNLLDNAIKYTPDGSGITIGAAVHGAELTVMVGDEGPGIPQGERERVFERFHRLDGGDDREVYGHGLGLYVARKLAVLQGGQLRMADNGGPGAHFALTLPLAESGEA